MKDLEEKVRVLRAAAAAAVGDAEYKEVAVVWLDAAQELEEHRELAGRVSGLLVLPLSNEEFFQWAVTSAQGYLGTGRTSSGS